MYKDLNEFQPLLLCHVCGKELGFDVTSIENTALQVDFVLDTSHCGPL